MGGDGSGEDTGNVGGNGCEDGEDGKDKTGVVEI
jgi:hypothetical protein